MIKKHLSSFLLKIDSESFKKLFSKILIFATLFYFLISLSSYVTWFPGSTKYFLFSTTSGILIRGLSSAVFLGAMFLGFLICRKEIETKWFVVVFCLIFFIIFFSFFAPLSYSVLYRTTALYNFMAEMVITVSSKTQIVMLISFIIDLLFGLSFLFVFPKVYHDKKLYIVILAFFILLIFYSCIYSFYFERNWYKYFFSGNWKYNPVSIGSIFGDKQQWGVFLSACFPCCFILINLLKKCDMKKIYKHFMTGFSLLTALLIFICSIVSFCKTAIVCNFLFIFVLALGICINCFMQKKNRIFSIIILLFFVVCLFLLILFRFVKPFNASRIGNLLDQIFKTLKSSGETGAGSRLKIMVSFLEKMPATNLMFGFPKGSLEAFEFYANPELINTLHIGIIIFFGRSGLVGLLIYFVLYAFVIKSVINMRNESFLTAVFLLGGLLVNIILNLSELEILVMSSSALVFVQNLILVSFPLSKMNERRIINEKKFISINC